MAIDERTQKTMDQYGVNEDEAQFIIDIEDGKIDGDVVYIKGSSDA
jgi:hypothetical protein